MISKASSIVFYEVNDDLPNFDNTSFTELPAINSHQYHYTQDYFNTDIVVIQVRSDKITEPEIKVYDCDQNVSTITPTLVASFFNGGLKYWEFSVDMALYPTDFYINVVMNSVTIQKEYLSNWIRAVEPSDEYLLIQWRNIDKYAELRFDTGITCSMRLKGIMRLGGPAGEQSVLDNQESVVKLKEEIKRIGIFEFLEMPDYIAELLRIASGTDQFYINTIQFTTESLPEEDKIEGTNFKRVTIEASQTAIEGLNTHDVGFDCDTGGDIVVGNLQQLGVDTDTSFTVPQGYIVQSITVKQNNGTGVLIEVGTTPGDNDLVYGIRPEPPKLSSETINADIADAGDAQLYVGVSGIGVDVDIFIITIKNRQ